MTEEQRDNLIVVLSHCGPSQVRKIAADYLLRANPNECDLSFYDFLKEKFEVEGYWKKVGSTKTM